MSDVSSERTGRRPPLKALLAAAVAIVLVVVVVALVVRSSGTSDSTPQDGSSLSSTSPSSTGTVGKTSAIARFKGDGSETTKPFGAEANWEIRWHAQDKRGFTVDLLDQGGASRGQIVSAGNRSAGSTFVSEGGEFELKISAAHGWRIQIIGHPLEK